MSNSTFKSTVECNLISDPTERQSLIERQRELTSEMAQLTNGAFSPLFPLVQKWLDDLLAEFNRIGRVLSGVETVLLPIEA